MNNDFDKTNIFKESSEDTELFSDIFGDEEFSSEETFNSDIFGDEVFGEDVFGDEIFGEEVFGGEVFSENKSSGESNFNDWMEEEGNPELINMNYKNPNNTIFFRVKEFDYDKDYSDLRFIFERFRSDLLEGE